MKTEELTKLFSVCFISVLSIGVIVIYTFDVMNNINPPPQVLAFLGTVFGYAIHALGVDSGVQSFVKSASDIQSINGAASPTIKVGTKESEKGI